LNLSSFLFSIKRKLLFSGGKGIKKQLIKF